MGVRRRIGGIAVVVAVSAGLVGSSFGQPKIKPPRPAAGWQAPVLVNADQAHRETSLAINPKNEKIMLACAPSGVPNTSYNQSYFHISKNGGRTWEPVRVENDDANDPRKYTFEGGDCDVAFDEGGTMYSADTWLGNLSVGHSRDNGGTWEGTPVAATGMIVDRPWLVGGPEGTIHVSYQDLQCCMPSAIWYTRSTDYGVTFQPTSMVASAGQEGAFTWQGNLVVSEDGNDLYLAYTRRAGAALLSGLDEQGPEQLFVAASHDGGASWTSNLVAAMPNPMSYLYPSLALDGTGKLHVVFSSMTEEDRPIWYSTSTDQAKTWTKPVPLKRGVAGWSPWIAVDDAGNAAVVWYGRPDPAANEQEQGDWYFYWARIPAGRFDPGKVRTGTTTRTPIFTGVSPIPEFENVRLDAQGRMHVGASAYRLGENGQNPGWAIYYQRQR
ncbi:MAG TPA: sialidase family protein [Actinomycetota bacterium]|nr:sialidase family protein [Actinomycetota bacterium]